MRKFLMLLFVGFIVVGLAACEESISTATEEELTDEEYDDVVDDYDDEYEDTELVPTNYETVQDFVTNFSLPDEIVTNVFLPDLIGEYGTNQIDGTGTISWTSDNDTVLKSGGIVDRTSLTEDTIVNLSCSVTLGGTTERFTYEANVLAIPETDQGKLEEAVNDFYLIDDNFVSRDIMVLPNITDLYNIYITWESTNTDIIDLEGNVYRHDTLEQEVTMTGTFTMYDYESKAGVSMTRSFDLTVGSMYEESVDLIDEDNDQILNKIYVESVSELYAAVLDPQPGDAIILADGNYNDFQYKITSSGTEENPIFIFATNPEMVNFTGRTQIWVNADYVVLANLQFIEGAPLDDFGCIVIEGSHNRLTNTVIDDFELYDDEYKWISLIGSYHEVDNCHLLNKATAGCLFTIWREDMTRNYHYVHNNHFENFVDTGGNNGYECMRTGTSEYSLTDGCSIIEYNLFEDIDGESEMISVKSGRNILRGNTIVDCSGSMHLRHGKNNLIVDNIFFCGGSTGGGGAGIRFYDGGHTIRNNYFYDCTQSGSGSASIVVHSGVNLPNAWTVINLQWTPYNVLIEGNTFVECTAPLYFDQDYTYASQDVKFNDNLVLSTGSCFVYGSGVSAAHTGTTFSNNMLYGTSICSNSTITAAVTADVSNIYSSDGIPAAYSDLYDIETAEFVEFDSFYGAQGLVAMTDFTAGATWIPENVSVYA